MGKREEPLTFKQEKFCKYYVDTEGNASEAYRMSYNTSNMKPETIWSAASRLLANSKVSTRINEIKAQRAKESEVERKTVERVLMDIVLANPDDLHFVDPATGKTKMRTPSQLPKRARNALKKIQNKRGEVTYESMAKQKRPGFLVPGMDGKPIRMSTSKVETEIKSVNFVIGFEDNENSEDRTILTAKSGIHPTEKPYF